LISDLDLGVTVRPVGTDPRNVLAAETADQVVPLLALEHRMKAVIGQADGNTILLGNSFLHPHWDKHDPTHAKSIQLLSCPVCQFVTTPDVAQQMQGRCPQCNSASLQPAMRPD